MCDASRLAAIFSKVRTIRNTGPSPSTYSNMDYRLVHERNNFSKKKHWVRKEKRSENHEDDIMTPLGRRYRESLCKKDC